MGQRSPRDCGKDAPPGPLWTTWARRLPDYSVDGGVSGDGPAAGLTLIDGILERGELTEYQFAHSARADLCRRLGRVADAVASYDRALQLSTQGPERRFLERRRREVGLSLD